MCAARIFDLFHADLILYVAAAAARALSESRYVKFKYFSQHASRHTHLSAADVDVFLQPQLFIRRPLTSWE